MITGLSHLTLAVSDLDRSVAFYAELLGFTIRMRGRASAYLEAGSLWLALVLDTAARRGPLPEYSHAAFSVAPSELPLLAQRLTSAGVVRWQESDGADSFYFLDPDGHKLELHSGDLCSRLRTRHTVHQPIWKAAENAVVAGDLLTLEKLLREHEPVFREQRPESSWYGGLAPDYSGADARRILAREHHFEGFDELAAHLEAIKQVESPIARFESAVEAVVDGELVTLERLLGQHPYLVQARSTRMHHATLLHYVGANGVESWRQRTPRNAVQVAEILIRAGAEVDAMADMYGGSTTLGLVATSIHPLQTGVQNDLIEALLNHGAAMDHPEAAGNRQGIINGCLANGRPGAAEFLAGRGARLDLEGAAGVGRLDAVRSFFNENGSLKANATAAQMKSGFQWACEYGRTNVVELLLQRGIEVGQLHRGQTGLHWASYGGHPQIVKLLLKQSAPVNVKDERWQNTPLGWALHGWANPPEAGPARYHEVVALLVAAGATIEPEWIPNEKVRGDARMLAALRGNMMRKT